MNKAVEDLDSFRASVQVDIISDASHELPPPNSHSEGDITEKSVSSQRSLGINREFSFNPKATKE